MNRPGPGPRPTRRTGSKGLRLGNGLLLCTLLLPAGAAVGQGLEEDFGRWESNLRHCRIVFATGDAPQTPPTGCRLVRLDQQLAGLLTVRFLQPAGNSLLRDRQLVFTGVLAEGSTAMRCRSGRCEPRWPLQLRVSAVGEAGFDASGMTAGLTSARIAGGNCLLEDGRLRCEASAAAGRQWKVEATP